MEDTDTDITPKEFQIRLRYKVSDTRNEPYELVLNNFNYLTIRNSVSFNYEKNEFNKKKRAGERILSESIFNSQDKYKEFKKYLNNLSNKKFYIPLSRYYLTMDNFDNYFDTLNLLDQPKRQDDEKYKFFINYNDNNQYEDNIKNYFTELKNFKSELYQKYKDNVEKHPSSYTEKVYNERVNVLNQEIQDIIEEYSKYIIDNNNLNFFKLSKEEKYSKLKNNIKKLRYIITYYNIFQILQNFYLSPGTILYENFFQVGSNNNIIKSKNKMYVKIKKIECIPLTLVEVKKAFDGEILLPIYNIEFEKIPTNFFNIRFHINLIDAKNPINILNSRINNIQKKNRTDKTNIITINEESRYENRIYKKYNNKIFSKNNKINSENKILINKKLNYKKLIDNFNNEKNKELFKKLEIKNIKDALLINETFNYLNKKYKIDDKDNIDNIDNIINYYIKEIFFKTQTPLFIDNEYKYANIMNVNIRLVNDLTFDELKNNNLNSKIEEKKLYECEYSNNLRLAIDFIDNIYNVYLDVNVLYKKNLTDKIENTDRIKYTILNCGAKSRTLKNLIYSFQKGGSKKNIKRTKKNIIDLIHYYNI